MKNAILKLKHISKKYKDKSALENLSLSIPKGSIYGFIGPNGAGKTTTMNILAGVLEMDSGEILYNNEISYNRGSWKDRNLSGIIGYVPDYLGLYENMTAWEYMELYAEAFHIDKSYYDTNICELLDMVNLLDRKEDIIGTLSHGMKNRLSLARALIHNPSVIILDEPLGGLDPRARREYKDILKALIDYGKTIFLSSHIMSELEELCTDIAIISNGQLIKAGSLRSIKRMLKQAGTLDIRIDSGIDRAVAILKELEEIKTIAIDGDRIVAQFEADRSFIAFLLERMVEERVKVYSYTQLQNDLESIYLSIT